jgi:hypothetical protein
LHTLLPNLQHTYLNLLMPLFLLQNAARVRHNNLEVLEVSDLGVLVRARLLSTELEWAPTSGEPIPYYIATPLLKRTYYQSGYDCT